MNVLIAAVAGVVLALLGVIGGVSAYSSAPNETPRNTYTYADN